VGSVLEPVEEYNGQRLRDMGAAGILEDGLTGKLQWWLVDHESMNGKRFQEVRDFFAELVDEADEHIPLGLDLDLASMIDREAAESLWDRDESLGTLQFPEDQDIFVWGVDVNHDDDLDDDNAEGRQEGTNDEYPG
jgi:hypothetical protein